MRLLPPTIAAQIHLLLSTNNLTTVGDRSGYVGHLSRGVPQGNPLSPALFNIYIDVLGERWERYAQQKRSNPTFFADDVIVFAKNSIMLQRFFDPCTG